MYSLTMPQNNYITSKFIHLKWPNYRVDSLSGRRVWVEGVDSVAVKDVTDDGL